MLDVDDFEAHVSSILAQLGLPAGDDDHRRVLAVLAYFDRRLPR